MKNNFKKILAFMLCVLMLSSALASCGDGGKTDETQAPNESEVETEIESESESQAGELEQKPLEIIKSGTSDFKIVVSQDVDYAADKASYMIKEAIKAMSGVSLPIAKDYEEFIASLDEVTRSKYYLQLEYEKAGGTTNMFANIKQIKASYDRSAPLEIIIGETDRPESIKAIAELKDENEFIVRIDGNKLVLVASSADAMIAGTEHLLSEYFGYKGEESALVTDLTVEDPKKSITFKVDGALPLSYAFDGRISKDVLCNYLARAVTISGASISSDYVSKFILNTGAKYICRFATVWGPSLSDYSTYDTQKQVIESIHESDPDVVFEACIFEFISHAVNDIPIPAWVFEAFGLEPEERNFSYDAMRAPDGSYFDFWGVNTSVPDITQQETMMFFYYRACKYIDTGYEALHMGQVHMIGTFDKGWTNWTKLLQMIREYASEHARRHFVFLNAHTDGIKDANGDLMFDFHMYPSRPVEDMTQQEHFPTEDNPQRAELMAGHMDAIYGKSKGGKTYSGWECDSLPYLVELDNGGGSNIMSGPDDSDIWVWGMDEITWFANQPASYRAEFLEYAYNWVMNEAGGDGFFAMPGHRTAKILDENYNVVQWWYMAFDPANCPGATGDEAVIKRIWESNPVN